MISPFSADAAYVENPSICATHRLLRSTPHADAFLRALLLICLIPP